MRRPLAFTGLAFLLFQMAAAFLPQASYWVLAAIFVVLFFVVRRTDWEYRRHIALVLITGVCALAYNALYTQVFVQPLYAYCGTEVQIQASVTDTIPAYTDGYVHATVRLQTVDGNAVLLPVSATLYSVPECSVGDIISVRTVLSPSTQNARANGVFLTGEYKANYAKMGESHGLYYTMRQWQSTGSQALRSLLQGSTGEMLAAMTLGDKSHLSASLKEVLRRAGISHMVVVSGLHLAVVSGAVYYFMQKLFCRRRKIAACIAMGSVVLFICFAGVTPSLVRAGTAMLLLFGGILLQADSDALTSLGFAALLLLLANPFAAVDIGLLLSFAATAGVLLVSSVNKEWQWHHENETDAQKKKRKRLLALAVPLAAALATLPVQAAAGYGVSVLGVVCNLLTVPLLPAVLCLGLLLALCLPFSFLGFMVQLLGFVCGLLIKYILAVAKAVASVPVAYIYVSGFYALISIICIYLVAFVAWRTRAKHGALIVVALIFIAFGLYGALDSNTYHLQLAGSGQQPALVLQQNERTVVIFRGGTANLAAVQDVLATMNSNEVEVLIDLRTDSDTAALAQTLRAKTMCSVQKDMQNNSQIAFGRGTIIYMVHQSGGNIACVDIGGYKLLLCTGKTDVSAYTAVDIYAGGTQNPFGLRTQYLWATTDKNVLQGEEVLLCKQIIVRSGQAVIFKEG